MSEKRKPEKEEPTAQPSAKTPEQETKPEEEKGKGLNYVFKIAPADPKNSFDFEDVADK